MGSAIAALFPRLSLTGFVEISLRISPLLLNSGSFTWFASPQLLMPLFNSKLIMQDINFNKIKAREACYEYQKTVLNALEEAENAIASLCYELERSQYLAEAQEASQEAYTLTQQLYQRGLKDYLEVLITNRSHLDAEDAYLESQITLLFHYIALVTKH